LAAGSIQREHQLRTQALAKRMTFQERFELAEKRFVLTVGEPDADQILLRPQP